MNFLISPSSLLLALLVLPSVSRADLIVSVEPSTSSIFEGTQTVDLQILFTADAGETDLFDTVTYVAQALNSRAGADPVFGKPVTISDFATVFSDWELTDQSGALPDNIVGGNLVAQSTSATGQVRFGGDANFSGVLMNMTLDTSGLLAGDTITVSSGPGFGFATSVGGGVDNVVSFSPASISVNAVPEPSSLMVLGLIGCGVLTRRKRIG